MSLTYWDSDTPPVIQQPGGVFWWSNNLATSAAQFKAMSADLSGEQKQQGDIAVALKKLIASQIGVMQPEGGMATLFKKLMAAGIGGQGQVGTSEVSMLKMIAAINAENIQQGTISAVLKLMSANGLGTQEQSGYLAPVFQKLISSLTGGQTQIGSMASTFAGKMSANIQASQIQQGDLSVVIPGKMASSMSGIQTQEGAMMPSFQKMMSNQTGAMLPQGTMATTAQKLVANLVGGQTQTATMASILKAMNASIQASQIQQGTSASLFKQMATALQATQAQSGSLVAAMYQASVILAGQLISATPVAFRTAGSAGSENLNTITCSVTPSANDSVLCFVLNAGAGSIQPPKYGASNIRMKCRGQIRCGATSSSSGIVFAVYSIDAVASGAATISITCTNNNWCQAAAIAYSNVAGYALTKTSMGQSSSALSSGAMSIPGAGSMLVNSFCHNQTISSVSGGTNRLLESAGFIKQAISDSSFSVTFSGTASSTGTWGGLMVPLLASTPSNPNINDCIGFIGAQNTTSASVLSVMCNVNDYVFLDVVTNGNPGTLTITCAGTAMTLVSSLSVPGLTGGSGSVLNRYVSATRITAGQISLGAVAVSVTVSAGVWWGACAVSISAITSIVSTANSSYGGSNSQPTQAISLSPGQYALHTFSVYNAPGYITNATNYYDGQDGQFAVPMMNFLDVGATVTMSYTSIAWGSMYTILS